MIDSAFKMRATHPEVENLLPDDNACEANFLLLQEIKSRRTDAPSSTVMVHPADLAYFFADAEFVGHRFAHLIHPLLAGRPEVHTTAGYKALCAEPIAIGLDAIEDQLERVLNAVCLLADREPFGKILFWRVEFGEHDVLPLFPAPQPLRHVI